MNKIHTILYLLIMAATFYSCSEDSSTTEIPDTKSAIVLSAMGDGIRGEVSAKAAPAFPNNGEIGVLAGYYVDGEPVDWKSYSDIDNARATVSGVSADSVYSFAWDSPKYWPFDNRELAFMAYSPRPNNESVFLDVTNTI